MDRPANVTLFDTGISTTHPLTVDALPTAVGRWQPVRAGVVNSWAWVDEQFLFCDGWCALVGQNGSGKSLTGGQWFPTMIDGNVRTAALSMSQRGAGNLADRHHNRTPGREKTGVWWLEFGFRAPDGTVRWMTLGLWIRWRGEKSGNLDRAWFVVSGRTDVDLHLHADGVPVDIDALCQQLAACHGRIFTDDRLQRAASRHLTVNSEEAYAEAVRAELFPGTDHDQMTALTTVLRVLRSVRVNDRMTADEMHATLTSALPALSTQYVELLAKDLTQSDDLLNKVNRAKREHELLTRLAEAYRRYANTAAASTGHALLTADGERRRLEQASGKVTREAAEHQETLRRATAAKQEAEDQLGKLRTTGELLRRRTEGHPGSHLPELATAVEAAHRTAELAAATAGERRDEADRADEAERKASATFHTAARHLTGLATSLHTHAGQAAADAFCAPFDAATRTLTADLTEPADLSDTDLDTLAETIKTWTHHRETVIDQVRMALAKLVAREEAEAQADATHAGVAAELATTQSELDMAQEDVAAHHDEAVRRLRAFGEEHGPVLGAVPVGLLASVPLDPDAIQQWADRALAAAVAKIDLIGAEARHEKATETAAQADVRLDEARDTATTAGAAVRDAVTSLEQSVQAVPQPPTVIVNWIAALDAVDLDMDVSFDAVEQCHAALREATDRGEALRHAGEALATAGRLHDQAEADATLADRAAQQLRQATDTHAGRLAHRDAAVAAFLQQIAQWTASLQVLTLQPGEIPGEADARDGDLHTFQVHLTSAVRRAETPLRDDLEAARRHAGALDEQLDALDAQIADAETEEGAPDGPGWRPPRTGRAGAPLWALVDFAPHVDDTRRAAIEGALLAGGILDAWVAPDAHTIAGDTLLRPGTPVPGGSLADVLIALPTDTITVEHITGILQQIAYDEQNRVGDVALIGDEVRTSWATAAAPSGWQPRYIGASARAEQRRRLLDSLRRRRTLLDEQRQAAYARVTSIEDRIRTLFGEAVMPDFSDVQRERAALVETHTALAVAQSAHDGAADRARQSRQQAQTSQHLATEACDTAQTPPDTDVVAVALAACTDVVVHLHTSRSRADALAHALATRADRTHDLALAMQTAAATGEAAETARRHDEQARHSRNALEPFDELCRALERLREAEAQLEQTSAAEAAARSEMERCRAATDEARRRRTAAATTKDGRQLPLEEQELDEFGATVKRLAASVEAWTSGAQRLFYLRNQAQTARDAATSAATLAAKADETARSTQARANTEQHRLDEERRLHERSFQDLLDEHARNSKEQEHAQAAIDKHDGDARTSEKELARLEERAATLTATLQAARQRCNDAYGRVLELFDHGLMADITDGDTYQRPDDLDQATALANRLTQGFPTGSIGEQLRQQSAALYRELRQVAEVFLRMGRHVSEEEFGTGGLRRIVLADTDTSLDTTPPTRPLRQAITDIGRRLQRLQRDYDEQLRTEIKGALFTQLRAQIGARIEQAREIVEGIRATLKGVRTGVERVGVNLDWDERKDDPVAQEALSYIQGPNLDGNFDAMYDFFIARLREDTDDESTSERITRVFDYRTWFTWKVEVTHRSFSDEIHPGEVFREITRRKNPLDTLSTGEKRLASMLPLLAAVKSFYSTPGFVGPRMAFVDELDAALDQNNLCTLLALLRGWDFDVLATLPTMGKLLVPEVRTTAIHKIIKNPSGVRFSVPYIWRGSGLPEAVRIAVPQQADRSPDGAGERV